jgi:hypothetical protein
MPLKLDIVIKKLRGIDWKLFLFLVLMMNVKLVVKIIAIIAIMVLERKSFTFKSFIRKPYILFYMGMIVIALVNLLLQYRDLHLPYLMVMGMGVLLWAIPAVAGYLSYHIVQEGDLEKMNRTVSFFFLVHVAIIFASLLMIIFEIRTIDPYTFKGLNQKYYISTGDYIRGITFDDAVTTAMISAFGLLYFLYRRRFFYSLLCMAGVLVIFSNLTNIFLLLIFVFLFIFKSDRVQKSMVVVYSCMLVIFVTTVSPQNNEYVVSFIYKMIGKAYYLPAAKTITREELKIMPDSLLSYDQKREKTGLLYIDSISEVLRKNNRLLSENALFQADTISETGRKIFYEYRPTAQVKQKENRFSSFLTFRYTVAEKDSLNKRYNWEKPGKITAALQLRDLYEIHPSVRWLGTGLGNFASRIAFKSAAIGIGGTYPEKYAYVHPYFQNAHLYVYLFYHAQWQINHTAANTPDSTYFQIAGEYGIAGICLFLFLYGGYFLWITRRSSYALLLVFLLLATFSVEYWFERLSIVILFEFLVFLDLRTMLQEGPTNE